MYPPREQIFCLSSDPESLTFRGIICIIPVEEILIGSCPRKCGMIHSQNQEVYTTMGIIFTLVGAIVGGLFTGAGIWLKKNTEKKKQLCTAGTTATVVDIKVSQSSENGTMYRPVFEYTANNQVFRKESDVSSSNCEYQVGQTVNMMYNPADPTYVYFPDDKSTSFISNICLYLGVGVGTLFVILGVVFIIIGI